MPVLMYHHVGPTPAPGYEKYSVTPGLLGRQLAWLRRLGYRAATLDGLIDRWADGADAARDVAITFDDGYRDCLDHAVPVLSQHGFTATFYLVSGEMGRVAGWLVRERGIALRIMDWADARQLARAGFAIGAHTVTHPRLALADRLTARRELRESKSRIEQELGCPVLHVSYPNGSYNHAVLAEARDAGYASGCTTDVGLAGPLDDRWALPRVPIDGRDATCDFVARVMTGHPARDVVRRAARRIGLRWTRTHDAPRSLELSIAQARAQLTLRPAACARLKHNRE